MITFPTTSVGFFVCIFYKVNQTVPSRKGSPNKVTASVKEAILLCYKNIGGDEAFARWAKKNPEAFYTRIYQRMIPVSVSPIDVNVNSSELSGLIARVFGGIEGLDAALSTQVDSGPGKVPHST